MFQVSLFLLKKRKNSGDTLPAFSGVSFFFLGGGGGTLPIEDLSPPVPPPIDAHD